MIHDDGYTWSLIYLKVGKDACFDKFNVEMVLWEFFLECVTELKNGVTPSLQLPNLFHHDLRIGWHFESVQIHGFQDLVLDLS